MAIVAAGQWACKKCTLLNTLSNSTCAVCNAVRDYVAPLFEIDSRHLFACVDDLFEANKSLKMEDVMFQKKHKLDEGNPEMQEFLSAHDLIEKSLDLKAKARRFTRDDQVDKSSFILDASKFDVVKVRNAMNEFKPSLTALARPTDVTNVDGFITHVTDEILSNQIQDATGRMAWCNVEREVFDASDAWAKEEWSSFKSKFSNGLGHRTHKLNNISKKVHMEVSTTLVGQEPPADVRGVIEINGGRVGGRAVAAGGAGGGHVLALPVGGGRRGGAGPQSQHHGLQLSGLQKRHINVVKRISHYRTLVADPAMQYTTEHAIRPAKEFAVEIQTAIMSHTQVETDNMSRKDLEGYRDLMDMLSEVTGENEAKHGRSSLFRTPVGTYSPICYSKALPDVQAGALISADDMQDLRIHAKIMRKMHLQLTYRNKHYLEHQLWTVLSEFVDGAVLRGEMTLTTLYNQGGESSRQKIRAYVRIRDHMVAKSTVMAELRSPLDNFHTPVWPYVYYLIKIGDLEGATLELSACEDRGLAVLPAAITVLKLFMKIVRDLHNAPPLTAMETQNLREAIQDVCNAFDMETNIVQQPGFCAFRMFVYGLLSLGDETMLATNIPESADQIPGVTASVTPEIEHTLWVHMWHAQWNGMLYDYCEGFDLIFQPEQVDNGELQLYESFLDAGGEKSFESQSDAAGSDPSSFTYAKVLFCCQRYGDAINYLWRKNKVFPAIHLAVVCLHYGLILPHMPLTGYPANPGSNLAGVYPADILREYTSCPFALDYPTETVDYLMCLRSQWYEMMPARERNAIQNDVLIWEQERISAENVIAKEFAFIFTVMDKSALDKVCGDVYRGVRREGYVDQFFPRNSVRVLLSEAAKHMKLVKGDATSAIRLHKLAENYGEVLEELNSQLCSALIPPHTKMKSWFDAATQYRNEVVPIVADILQQRDEDEQVSILDSMLHLCNFMDLCRAGKYRVALNTLDLVHIPTPGCSLVPNSSEKVSPCAVNMNSLTKRAPNIESALRTALNDILLEAMKCTHLLHDECKRNVASNQQLQNDMVAYRMRADAIIEFSGKIVLRIDTQDQLHQIGDKLF